MPFMNWSIMFSTHIDSIDEQHKVLLGYINELHDAMSAGIDKSKMGDILDKLANYTVEHFGYEEALFAKYGYENKDEHEKHHVNLKNQVDGFVKKFKSGEVEVSSDLMSFLKDWLMNHIIKEDKKYVHFLKENGVT